MLDSSPRTSLDLFLLDWHAIPSPWAIECLSRAHAAGLTVARAHVSSASAAVTENRHALFRSRCVATWVEDSPQDPPGFSLLLGTAIGQQVPIICGIDPTAPDQALLTTYLPIPALPTFAAFRAAVAYAIPLLAAPRLLPAAPSAAQCMAPTPG